MDTSDKKEATPPQVEDPKPGVAAERELALGDTLAGGQQRAGGSSAAPAPVASAATPKSSIASSRLLRPLSSANLPIAAVSSMGTPLPRHIEEALSKPSADRQKVIDDELPRGASLGRYIVLSCLGAGGMGVVYAAYDPELDRKVAIKLLRNEAAGNEASEARMRLLREAQAMARLQHAQVIAVYDVGTIEGQVFIAMEFIDGHTLTSWLKEQSRSQAQILEVFTLAGRGLAAAHAVGLVHRDFKPDNVLVGKEGQVRVTDFGLARRADQSDEHAPLADASSSAITPQMLSVNLTRTGALMGTPRYMAPEQYQGGKTDPRTDQFCFCVALYEALYGSAPFAGDSIATLGFNVVSGRVLPPPPEARIPTWMRQVLLRGLSVNPDDRYPNMDALLTALNRERTKVSWRWLIMAAVVMVALAANLAWNLRKESRETPCRGFEKRLVGVWDEKTKQQMKDQLIASGRPYAADVWERVEQALDVYTQEWVKMRGAACLARVRDEQLPAIFELRRRCLDERLEEVIAFTNILRKPEEVVIDNASTAVHDLSPLGRCADVEALQAPPPLPENPKTRAEIERMVIELAEVRAEQRFGRYGVVIDKTRRLVQRATELNYLPVLAEARYLLAQVEERSGMARQAEKTFVRAAASAMESRNQRLVAQTWTRLTALTGYRLNQPEKAESWDELADAALDSLSPSDAKPLRAELELARCRVQSGMRQWDRAIQFCQSALSLRTQLYGTGSPEVAEVLHTLGGVYRRQGNFDQAMHFYQEALDIERKELGELHPDIASELRGMGLLFRDQRRYSEAQDYLSRALTVVQKSLGPEHILTSDYHLYLGTSLLYLNRLVEAERALQHAFDIREKADDSDGWRRAEVRYFLGVALARQGQLATALKLNQEGLEIGERDRNRKEVRIAFNLHAIGVILHAMGRSNEAVPYLERALSVRQNMRPEELQANLNRLAETQFALAQALWAVARGRGPALARATELARQAQANYSEWGSRPENELSTVTWWLSQTGNKPHVPPFGGLVVGEGSRGGAVVEPAAATPSPAPVPVLPAAPAPKAVHPAPPAAADPVTAGAAEPSAPDPMPPSRAVERMP